MSSKITITDDEFIALFESAGSKAAAEKLMVSERTVRRHRRSVEEKIGRTVRWTTPINQRVKEIGFSETDWPQAWDKTGDMSILIRNPMYVPKSELMQVMDSTLEAIKRHSPKYKAPAYNKIVIAHCAVINPTDMHWGGWDMNKTKQALQDGISDALAKSKPFNINRIKFITGSDALHTDTANYTTTAGTAVRTNGCSYAEVFDAARDGYVSAIEQVSQVAPTDVINLSGNHDEKSSIFLAKLLEAWFRNHKGVGFDVDDEPRKYAEYGNSFMGFTHGDRVREADLPLIAAHEAAEMWGRTLHRYIYLGHLHHVRQIKYQAAKEVPGIIMEWLRAPKPADDWHKKGGFIAGRSLTNFVHSEQGGQVAKFIVNL